MRAGRLLDLADRVLAAVDLPVRIACGVAQVCFIAAIWLGPASPRGVALIVVGAALGGLSALSLLAAAALRWAGRRRLRGVERPFFTIQG